ANLRSPSRMSFTAWRVLSCSGEAGSALVYFSPRDSSAASLIETWIDQTERRTWFLSENSTWPQIRNSTWPAKQSEIFRASKAHQLQPTHERRISMPYINVGKENSGNIDLYYEDHGSGKPVV